MYSPKYFTETDNLKILDFMRQHPFVTLICNDGVKNHATQIPVFIEQRGNKTYILGHVFKFADHYLALEKANEVLVMFTGPHCYVSASWYAERGQASTWDYMTVQVRGKINILDSTETKSIINKLTHQYEDRQGTPELLENMDDNYIQNNLKAIAGFEIEVIEQNATFKLSQNRSEASFKNIVDKLEQANDYQCIEISREMRKQKPELFK